MGASHQWKGPQLMAHHPSYPSNDLTEDFTGLLTPKPESPSHPIVTTHQECVPAETSDYESYRLDDFVCSFDDNTERYNTAYGRKHTVLSGSTAVIPTNVLGTATILQAPLPIIAQDRSPLQPPSSPKGDIISSRLLEIKPESAPTAAPRKTHQVKEELRHLISSRQPQATTSGSTDQDDAEMVDSDSTNIENGVDLDRQKRRREQNRQAAQRCRQRKRHLADSLHRECQALECSNTELQFKIRTLEGERDKLRLLWNAHVQRHGCAPTFKPRLPVSKETDVSRPLTLTTNSPTNMTQEASRE